MPPKNWAQINEDGFGYPPCQGAGDLFTFGGSLFAKVDVGVFRLESLLCLRWQKVYTPALDCVPLGSHLFSSDYSAGKLWCIAVDQELGNPANWVQVTSQGTPGGAHPYPMAKFGGRVYGVLYPDNGGFGIWRSEDAGQPVMTWMKVVDDAFGDPDNNTALGFVAVFNGKLYAGTNTLQGVFGAEQFQDGVEVWESPTGDLGSWKQINVDGFGTEVPSPSGQGPMRVNNVIGSWAVYRPPGQSKDYLFIGTSSHWGGEVWRYDGSGLGGWMNIQSFVGWGPARNAAMVSYGGYLYLGEGFPGGNLARYDGSWQVVEPGPNPFHPDNSGIAALAVRGPHLFALTVHKPYSGVTKGDQVYAYPYYPVPAFVCEPANLFSSLFAQARIRLGPWWTASPVGSAAGRGRGNGAGALGGVTDPAASDSDEPAPQTRRR